MFTPELPYPGDWPDFERCPHAETYPLTGSLLRRCSACGTKVEPRCSHPAKDVVEKSDRPNSHGVFFTWDACGLCGEQLSTYRAESLL